MRGASFAEEVRTAISDWRHSSIRVAVMPFATLKCLVVLSPESLAKPPCSRRWWDTASIGHHSQCPSVMPVRRSRSWSAPWPAASLLQQTGCG